MRAVVAAAVVWGCLTADACFVETPDTSQASLDISIERGLATAELCWAACEARPGCATADFRMKTKDCWLKRDGSATVDKPPWAGISHLTPCPETVDPGEDVGLLGPQDRIAISADGNFRDEDDIGSTPMTLALLVYGGALDRVTYYGYRSHVWADETPRALKIYKGRSQDERMQASASESVDAFGLDADFFVDEKAHYDATGEASQARLVAAIEAAGDGGGRLWVIVAGPMQTIYASLTASNPGSLKDVTLVTHSRSNNEHAELHGGVTWEAVKRLVLGNGGRVHAGGSVCLGCLQPTVNKPRDQNKGLDFRKAADPMAVWRWLNASSDARLRFVYDRIADSNVADVSDAGMIYYVLTGDDGATPDKLRTFLTSSTAEQRVPSVSDFVHRPAVFASPDLRFVAAEEDAQGMRSWRDCVKRCISVLGADCVYVQFDRQTPKGTCIVGRTCDGETCSTVRDVNKSGIDFNRVNCRSPMYLGIQRRVDAATPACTNVF